METSIVSLMEQHWISGLNGAERPHKAKCDIVIAGGVHGVKIALDARHRPIQDG